VTYEAREVMLLAMMKLLPRANWDAKDPFWENPVRMIPSDRVGSATVRA
jgi:hypothetical protein